MKDKIPTRGRFTRPLRRAGAEVRADGGGRPRTHRPLSLLAQLIFWSWNGLLATVAICGLLPLLGFAFVRDSVNGTLPMTLLIALCGLIALPIVSIVWGYTVRGDPWRLMAIFYGVEVPLLVLGVLRLFLVQELTPQLALTGFLVLLGLGAFAVATAGVLQRGWQTTSAFALLAVFGAFAIAYTLLGGLYAFPVLIKVIIEARFDHLFMSPASLLVVLLVFGFFTFTSTLFVASPVVASLVYIASLLRLAKRARRTTSGFTLATVTAGVALAIALVLRVGLTQPHERAFALLETTPTSDAARRALLSQSEVIRGGLLDAYLAPYRYVGNRGGDSAITDIYASTFGGERDDYAFLAAFNDFMVAPFLFDDPEPSTAGSRAREKYATFFDVPIEEAEAQRVDDAMQASFDRSRVEASLLDRNAERVLVARQSLAVTAHGDWADVELYEEYVNQTHETEEVLYHFTLPESAVVTGLWLGETADKAQASAFKVAPRGAAQRVYREEVRRGVDPALLEQVGPRQYRLRVFPVLPETLADDAQPVHMWLTFAVMRDHGRYPMPVLGERRNAYLASSTVQTLDAKRSSWNGWLPDAVVAPTAPARERLVHVDGYTVRVTPRELSHAAELHGLRIAVVVDRSRSMGEHARDVEAALETVRESLAANNTVEVILSAAANRGEPVIKTTLENVPELVYYGGQSLSSMLRDAGAMSNADLSLVLTDDDGVKHETDTTLDLGLQGALWLVHLGGGLPTGYADVVSDQLGAPLSGIATSVDDAVERYSASRSNIVLDGDYAWSLVTDPGSSADASFTPLAARALVRMASSGWLTRDAHRLAVDHAIVTPFSSMIVLVNERQLAALAAESAGSNAFQRETETGTAPPPQTGWDAVTGVPEPEEWLLIGIAGAALLIAARRRAVGFAKADGVNVMATST